MDALAPFAFDFFISRRGSVAAVAREVADVLEAEGYRVTVQDYDFAAGGQFVLDIDEALRQARQPADPLQRGLSRQFLDAAGVRQLLRGGRRQ
ncbi:MAG TPA: toll/interleukin-1 receptor domain-containing protein [Acetobacteraceae bacterium]|nr:toll/interleukin-1 receptor domain-containing protein [Acetobacteraceae bacterium]